MKQYLIEVSNPPFPSKGYRYSVMRTYKLDSLSPNLVTLYSVMAESKADAIAQIMCGKAKTIIGSK